MKKNKPITADEFRIVVGTPLSNKFAAFSFTDIMFCAMDDANQKQALVEVLGHECYNAIKELREIL